jgi:hypothetical protein
MRVKLDCYGGNAKSPSKRTSPGDRLGPVRFETLRRDNSMFTIIVLFAVLAFLIGRTIVGGSSRMTDATHEQMNYDYRRSTLSSEFFIPPPDDDGSDSE